MSFENDARECLLDAIESELKQVIQPADLNVAKPSDPDFRCDFVMWRKVLEEACSLLRDRGHAPNAPTNEEASKLVDKTMSNSMRHLVRLCKDGAREATSVRMSWLTLGLGVVTLTAATAAVTIALTRRGGER